MEEKVLPKFNYYIDESDPDVVVLRRQDGAFVAAFSARGATSEAIVEAAKEDYGELIKVHADCCLSTSKRTTTNTEALRAAREKASRAGQMNHIPEA